MNILYVVWFLTCSFSTSLDTFYIFKSLIYISNILN